MMMNKSIYKNYFKDVSHSTDIDGPTDLKISE